MILLRSSAVSRLINRKNTIQKLVLVRQLNYLKIFSVFKKSDEQMKSIDGVAPHYRLIYKGDSNNYIRGGYTFVTFGSMLSGTMLLLNITGFVPYSAIILSSTINTLVPSIAFLLLLTCSMYRISKKYVLRMYYSENEDKFVAVTLGMHPFSYKSLEVLPGEMQRKPTSYIVNQIAPWSTLNFVTKSKRVFMFDPNKIFPPYYYNHLLGFE